ncbi:putative cadherin domain-containing protein [Synechococcus sp. A18-46.1]|nr:putative cadherin domain-containing protein [Synechococcus sp. A18-46.1]
MNKVVFSSFSLVNSGKFTSFTAAKASELIVADGACPQIRKLLTATEALVLWLDGQELPLETVSRALAERRTLGQPVDTLHWVSHGSPGELHLGDNRINSAYLLANAQNLANWELSNLALWSCRAGADHNFIALLEELTGTTIWSTANTLGCHEDGSSHWTLATRNASSAAASPALPVEPARRQAWPAQLNGAPVASGSPSLAAISEESTDPAGETVANLFSSSFSDVDSDTLAGIAITANAATASQGAWQYSTDDGSNWTAIATTGLADATALYLTTDAKLRFLPAADFSGTPGALTTRLIDNSAGIPAASSPSINPFGLADAANYIAPDFVDIDGDGDLDAFIGNNHGNTVFFQNNGTSDAPDFSGGSTTNPFGLADVGFYASPDFVDIDGDGDLDAFIGNSVGNTVFLLNTGTSAAPDFSGGSTTNPFGLADVGDRSTPVFADIDADGDLDAFIGQINGTTVFFLNTGTSAAPDFSGGSTTSPFGISDVGTRAAPDFVDIDGDGDLDAFIGDTDGTTAFFNNTGTSAAPDFTDDSTVNPFGISNVGLAAAPVFADIDGDGLLDAFIGDRWGNTVFFHNTGTSSAPAFAAGFAGRSARANASTNASTIDVSTNGNTTDISAATLSLSTAVTAVNDSPTITGAGSTLAFTEGNGATVIDSSLTITDADDTNIESATVSISSGFQSAEDVLAFSNTSAIMGSWNASTGVLTLTGSDSLANYKAALESVTYNNTSDNPNTSNRIISWVVNDGDTNSSAVTSTISVAAVNDAPVISGASATLAFSEGNGATIIDSSLTITDADDTNIESATVSISSGFQSAEDVLAFLDTSSISGSWNASTGVLTLTGSGTLANYKAALESVTYNNTSDTPNTSNRIISWVVNDGDTNSSAVTYTISVAAVNDAPVIAGASATLAFSEGNGATIIDSSLTITDADDSNIESATVSISSGFQSAEDVLAFSDTSAITGSWNASTGVLTLTGSDSLANYKAAFESVTYNNTSDNPNTADRTISWVVNDGDTNSSAVTSTITVTAVNNAPVISGASATLAFSEEDGATPIDSSLTITDADDTNIESATVSISSGFQSAEDVLAFLDTSSISGSWNASTGVLTLTGSDSLANYKAALESVTYNNTSDNPNTADRTISWLVNDGDTDSSAVTSTITVTAVNDAPVTSGSPSLAAISEDSTDPVGDTVANLFSSSFSDVDGDSLVGIAITANAATASQGAWQYSTDDGSNWTAIATTGLADATALYLTTDAKLRFLPAADFSGTPGALTTRLIENSAGIPAASSPSINPFGISDVGSNAAPVFADIDADGDLDAFIGNYDGNTVFFQNNGTSAVPDFSRGSTTNPFGISAVSGSGRYEARPDFVDIDGDGDLDAFIGNRGYRTFGDTVFFLNTGTSAAPDFSGGSTTNPFGLEKFGYYVAPEFVDIDGDVDLDAFIGNNDGNTVFFQNTGTSTAPDFSAGSTTNPFGISDVGDRSNPDFADIDGDGDLDALIGDIRGLTVFFQNTGTSAAPDFSGGSTTNPFGISDVGSRSAPDFADIDADGDLDAFIGNNDGNTVYFNNTGTSAAPAFTAGFAGSGPDRADASTVDVSTNGNTTDISAATLSLSTAVTVQVTDDDNNNETQVISLTVNAADDIVADSFSLNEDATLTYNVLSNDSFDGSHAISAISQGSNGSVEIVDADAGTLKYTPNEHFNGSDSFTYTVTSGGVTETATVSVTINQQNDAGSFGGDTSTSGAEGVTITGTLSFTDAADGDSTPNFTVSSAATSGTASINATTGAWTYTPNADFNGSDSFTVEVTDGDGNKETQTISLTIDEAVEDESGLIIIASTSSATDDETSDSGDDSQTFTNTSSTQTGIATLVENTASNDNLVTVTLPPGVSITSEGSADAQSSEEAQESLTESIQQLKSETETTDDLIGNVNNFINQLPDSTQVDVRTIVPTTTSTNLEQPIVFTGSSGSSTGDDQTEAFIIDLSNLPSGTEIQLDNIDFAVIIGSVEITGGSGSNVVYADDSAQIIVLGEDDDTLHGGGGNDTIGAAGGDDLLIGGRGQDLITGGADNDTLKGGPQTDLLFGGQGRDHLNAGRGDDTLKGGRGQDTLRGSSGDDLLKGQLYHDSLHGGSGDDTLFGGKGQDTLTGAKGSDTFKLSKGNDTIRDFSITEGDLINAPNNLNLQLIQRGNHLLLKDSEHNIKTTLLNINHDDLITYQPDLI